MKQVNAMLQRHEVVVHIRRKKPCQAAGIVHHNGDRAIKQQQVIPQGLWTEKDYWSLDVCEVENLTPVCRFDLHAKPLLPSTAGSAAS